MSLAWTKQSRIRKSREFRVVQKYGQKWKSTDFLFIFLGSKRQQSQPRVGLIASKKVGNAVVRNMVKRRLREACRKKILTIESATDIVIVAFSSASTLSQKSVEQQVSKAFKLIQSKTKKSSVG